MAREVIDVGASLDDPSATDSVRSAFQKVNAMSTELYDYRPINVLDYGALGNSHHSSGGGADDTVAIQDAIDAAMTAGSVPVVHIPGWRTYRITDTIVVPIGCHVIGLGGQDAAPTTTQPIIVWDGAAGETMFDVSTDSTNIPNTKFEGLSLCGKLASGNSAGCAIKYRPETPGDAARTDNGTTLRNVQVFLLNGDAIRFEGRGSTNFRMTGGRFDSIYGGYGIYADLTADDASFVALIDGNVNWVGGSGGQGKGFMHLDGASAASGSSHSHVTIQGLHTECNQDMSESFASGTNPSDRQGIIRLGCTPANNNVQHEIHVQSWTHSFGSGAKSHSIFQLTAASGTDDEVSDMVMLSLDNGHALHAFVSSDSGTTDEVRLIGGMVPTARRWPHVGGIVNALRWGQGKDFNSTATRSFYYSRYANQRHHGLGLIVETVSTLPSFVYGGAGALAVVSDSNSTTRGATVAGGGANIVLVFYNGTNWIIV